LGSSQVSHSFISDFLSQVDIVDVISHYLSLKRSGRNYVCLCPFHVEKTPSFVVSPEKQIFKCFGCGIGGNAITFVQKYENLSFWEAVKRVAEICGVELPKNAFSESSEFEKVEEAGLKAAKFFHSKLFEVKEYLASRGIEEKTAQKFLIGFAPPGYLKQIGIGKEEAKELGLLSSSGKEFFKNRLVIPIFNHSGKFVAFAGRALSENQGPKYINSPETKIFKKNSVLFGFYQAKEEILKKREAIVVEGYFDVISLYQIGVRNAVAPMGTSLTENHVRFLKRYSPSPILMFDGDSAGTKAAVRSAGLFLKAGCSPRVVQLPEGEDPDTMARNFPEELKELISSAQPFIKWAVSAVKREKEKRVELLQQVAFAVSELRDSNPFLFKENLSILSAEFGIDEKWLKAQIPKMRENKEEKEKDPIPPREKAFLKAIFEGWIPPVEISPNVFVSPEVAKIYSLVLQTGEQNPAVVQTFYPELSDLISEILLLEFSEEEIKSSLSKILAKGLKRFIGKLDSEFEKKAFQRLINELKKGNFEAIRQLQTG
jgi:DNA primase